MRKVAVLIVMFTALCARGVSADSEAARPYADLSGRWEGTANGSHRGACRSGEDRVYRVSLRIAVDDAGSFTARCIGCPDFLTGMVSQPEIAGKVDAKMHVVATQKYSYSSSDTNQAGMSAINWVGDFKRANKKLDRRASSTEC
jgi:hypothetical protein